MWPWLGWGVLVGVAAPEGAGAGAPVVPLPKRLSQEFL